MCRHYLSISRRKKNRTIIFGHAKEASDHIQDPFLLMLLRKPGPTTTLLNSALEVLTTAVTQGELKKEIALSLCPDPMPSNLEKPKEANWNSIKTNTKISQLEGEKLIQNNVPIHNKYELKV